MICLVVSEIKVEFLHCSWPVYEIASDSLSLWEFREGQTLLRLCGTTETVWEMVNGWTRQGHAWNDLQFQSFITVAQRNPEGGSHPYCTINTLEMPAVKNLGSDHAQNSFSPFQISLEASPGQDSPFKRCQY